MHKPRQAKSQLGAEPSAALRDQLLKEIKDLTDGDDLALWAHRRIAAKNTLTPNDALAIEAAYRALLEHQSRFPANRDFYREKSARLTV